MSYLSHTAAGIAWDVMNLEVIGAAVAVVGALLWIRRDMRHDIAELRRDLTAQIAAVNTRIDNILLADRKTP